MAVGEDIETCLACMPMTRKQCAAPTLPGYRAPVLQLPTGAGKTVIFAEVARRIVAKGRRVLVLVHRRELNRQASDKLIRAGVTPRHHRRQVSGQQEPVQVASVQTLACRPDSFDCFDMIIIDEAHHARAKVWQAVLARCPQAWLLGVTTTPTRLDGKGLGIDAGGIFDAIVAGPSVRELIAEGYLSPARCFVPSRKLDLTGVKSRAGNYVVADLVARVDRPEIAGDALQQYRPHADHQPAIVYCCDLHHAKPISETFWRAGYRAAYVHGRLSVPGRDRPIAGLGDGEIEELTSCDLISEGLDVPSVGPVVLLRPAKSLTLFLQQIGRGMRPAPGKDALIILDHAGNVIAHDFLDQDRKWSLTGAEKTKKQTLKRLTNGEVGVGRQRQITKVSDALEEVKRNRLDVVASMSYWQAVNAGLSQAELRHYARCRGYNPRWVSHVLRRQRAFAP